MQSGIGRQALVKGFRRMFGLICVDPVLAADLRSHLLRAERAAQAAAIARERPIRLIVIVLLFAVFLQYLPWYAVLPAAIGVLLADWVEARSPRWTMVTVYLGELCFCLPAAVIWHSEDPLAKAISIGVFSAAMIRLATIRSVQPTTGFAGLAGLASLIAASNTFYWIRAGNLPGLAYTTLIAVVSVGYVLAAILQNHEQKRLAATSEQAALRASEAKSRFLTQMSHELRTPLNAIIGTGTAAFLQTTDEGVKEQLAVLLKSAEGLSLVLNDVLDVSAVEEGHLTLRPRVVDVADEVCQTVALFRPQAQAAGLTLQLKVQGQVPKALLLDFDRLRQCLSNLLSNALKHTMQGQITVDLAHDPTGWLVLAVHDSGPGVPASDAERIFQRYARASTKEAGHGLGLSICRMLIDRMGGQIRLAPSDHGARFELRVPVVAAAPDAAPADLRDLGGVRVLVVDDIATNRLVAATYLGLLNCNVVEASSGPAALALLDGVDIVLLDMNMPGMDGLQTLAGIRAAKGPSAHVPVVAMTADAEDQDQDRARYLSGGLDGYVTKPVHLNALHTELARVLAKTALD